MSLVAIVLTVFRELASTASPSPIEGMTETISVPPTYGGDG
jgi:hypothetical protein